MRFRRPRPPSSEDEQERLRLLATLQRLLGDIDGLVVQTRGRSKVSAGLLEALRRTNQERITLERQVWLLEDRILRDILSCVSARRPLDPDPEPLESHARQQAEAGGAGVAQALAATAAGRLGPKSREKGI